RSLPGPDWTPRKRFECERLTTVTAAKRGVPYVHHPCTMRAPPGATGRKESKMNKANAKEENVSKDLTNPLIEASYPFQAHLGFEIAEWREDFCRLTLPLAPFLMNRHGIPHGGLHATLLDTAMGFATCYTGDPDRRQLVLTLSLNVN